MSPGRNPSRSPASTAGRVRMILPTWRSARAATASAIARYVFPVPAGPIAKVTVWSRIASTYCFCMTVFGAIFLPRWRQTTSSNTSRMSSASSIARTTAPTVSGPISWPPSTSSTSSSTTARASETCVSSPSIVSTLPRSRIVHWRRSRSASRTPSPTPASSAATSFETGKVSCTRFSLGKRVDPPVTGMHHFERFAEPRSARPAEERSDQAEVVLVLRLRVPGLVQELDLGCDDRNAGRRALRELAHVQRDARVPPAHPQTPVRVVQEELAFLVAGFPGIRRRTARYGTKEDLVDRELQDFAVIPRVPHARPRDLECRPVVEVHLQIALVVAEDADLEVLVLARHLVQEEVDRPAAADEPGMGVAVQLREGGRDVVERAQASFSRTSWLTAEPTARPAT